MQRWKDYLVINYYKFREVRTLVNGNVSWHCCKNTCSCSLKTNKNRTKIVEQTNEHNHKPSQCNSMTTSPVHSQRLSGTVSETPLSQTNTLHLLHKRLPLTPLTNGPPTYVNRTHDSSSYCIVLRVTQHSRATIQLANTTTTPLLPNISPNPSGQLKEPQSSSSTEPTTSHPNASSHWNETKNIQTTPSNDHPNIVEENTRLKRDYG